MAGPTSAPGRRPDPPRRRVGLALAIVAVGGVLAAFVVAVGYCVVASVEPADAAALQRVLRDQLAVVFWSWVLATVLCGLLIARLWERYAALPQRMASATALIATANPALRLPVHGPAELRELAGAVNQLADRCQHEQADVAQQIAAAGAELEAERHRLAVLMSELSVAVLVCNGEGRIMLYNAAARQLLDPDGGGWHAQVGLGRSVFAILDRGLVDYALERVHADRGGHHSVATVRRGRLLRAQIAPVHPIEPEVGRTGPGFVVTLEDMTHRAEVAQAREGLIGSLTLGTRSAIGNIRAAVETVLDYPQMEPAERERFLQIISEEAAGLGRRLDDALSASTGAADDTWQITDLRARDLLQTVARDVGRTGLTVTVVSAPEDLWLHVDGFALQRTIAVLLDHLRTDHGIGACGLRAGDAGGLVELDLTWSGADLPTSTLREWISQPPPSGRAADTGGSVTPHDVLARHGAEIWSGGQATPYIRMLLPRVRPDQGAVRAQSGSVVPAGPNEPDGRTEAVAGWLADYDFSLISASSQEQDWRDRTLTELSYTVFDTETTGLYPAAGDEIISIGAVRIVNSRLLRQETFDQLIDPRRSVPEASIMIHGIEPERLVGRPTIEQVLPAFAAFAEDTVLVGHNVAFDLQFLRCKRDSAAGLLSQPVLDTLLLSAVAHPDQDRHTLEEIAARLGVEVIGRHTALWDAVVTGEVFLRLLEVLGGQGMRTLGELQDAARRTYQAKVSGSLYAD